MNENLYFTIGAFFFAAGMFGPFCYLFALLKNYVFEEELAKLNKFYCGFNLMIFFEKDFLKYQSSVLNFAVLTLSFLFSTFLLLIWPAVIVFLLAYGSLRTARFLVRISRGINKLSKVAHDHKDGEVKREDIGKLEF